MANIGMTSEQFKAAMFRVLQQEDGLPREEAAKAAERISSGETGKSAITIKKGPDGLMHYNSSIEF